jgi:FKBP-type peptidyl-prolyl cis-trans isomerase FkpA
LIARTITVLVLGAVVVACGDSGARDDAPAVASSQVTTTYAPELDVDLERMGRTDSGLFIEELQAGDGELAEPGRTVLVEYTGWLPDGRQFDSSRQAGRRPIDFVLGQGDVIPGWEEGLQGMRVGGRRRLVIPPSLAYGTEGTGGVIPPNATLVFDVELVGVL